MITKDTAVIKKPRSRKAPAATAVPASAPVEEPKLQTVRDIEEAILLPYQREWARDKSRFKCGIWARQTGKSFSTAEDVAADVASRPAVMWMIAAPSERQSLESLDKVKTWLEAFGVLFADEVDALVAPDVKAAAIKLSNGSRVVAVPGRPDTVRGFSCNVWLDEVAYFDDPAATWKAILPSITNKLRGGEKRVIVTSTPNGRSGRGKLFYDICTEPDKGKMKWSVHTNRLKDCIADGLPVDYEEMAAALGDPLAEAQELCCEFLDGSDTLLPYDLTALAVSGLASLTADPGLWNERGHLLVCGVDFGRTSDPTVCWTLERQGDTWITREVLVLRGMSTPDQEKILSTRLRAASRCCLDYTGPGIGLGDYLAEAFGEYKPTAHKFGKVELCTFTAGFKREIFPRLRRAFEPPTMLRIPGGQELLDDLAAYQQTVNDGVFTYWAPRTKEGHSDRCTALALAVRATADCAGVQHFGTLTERLGSRRVTTTAVVARKRNRTNKRNHI